jgi:hypothetical protein
MGTTPSPSRVGSTQRADKFATLPRNRRIETSVGRCGAIPLQEHVASVALEVAERSGPSGWRSGLAAPHRGARGSVTRSLSLSGSEALGVAEVSAGDGMCEVDRPEGKLVNHSKAAAAWWIYY